MHLAAALEGERLALNRIERELAAHLVDLAFDVLGGTAGGDDMIGQDRRQLALVLRQQRFDRALAARRRLRWLARTPWRVRELERLDQARGLYRRGQRRMSGSVLI